MKNPNHKSTGTSSPRNNDDSAPVAAVQTALAGLPGGVELDLIPAEYIAHAAELDDVDELAELDEEPWMSAAAAEVEECRADLQQRLQLDRRDSLGRKKPKYVIPDVATLHACACNRSGRKKLEHAPEHEFLAHESDRELARRMHCIYKFKADGLSELDLAVQREWTQARAVGAGWYDHKNCSLPITFWELGGHKSAVARRVILCALMLAMVAGKNGMTITAPQAWVLWEIHSSVWWDAIAWLEEKGFLVRGRRYKNNDAGSYNAPVHKISNWYGPGPELVKRLAKIRGVFGGKSEADQVAAKAAKAEAKRHRVERQRIVARRRNEARRARRGQPSRPRAGADADRFAMKVVEAARRVERRRAAEVREQQIRQADPAGFRPTGDYSSTADTTRVLDDDQVEQLERAAAPPQVIDNLPIGAPRGGGGRLASSRDGPALAGVDDVSLLTSDKRTQLYELEIFAAQKERSGAETSSTPARAGPSRELASLPPPPRGSPDAPTATQPASGVDPPPDAITAGGAERLPQGQRNLAGERPPPDQRSRDG